MNTTRIVFDCPISPWWIAVAAAIILAAVVVLVVKDVRRVSQSRLAGRLILLLALVGLGLLTGMVLGPRMVRTWRDPHKPGLPILVDGSRSMLLTDAYTGPQAEWLKTQRKDEGRSAKDEEKDGPSRLEVANLVLNQGPDGWLAKLANVKGFDLAVWRFAGDPGLAALPLGQGAKTPAVAVEVDPEGYSTALGDALDRIAHSADGSAAAPRAVVLLSDGAWNAGLDPTEAARALGRLGTAVYVIGIGDPNPPRDVAVLAAKAPKRLLLGDELVLTAEVSTSGMGAVRIPVQLLRNGEVVDTKEIVGSPTGAGGPIKVNFSSVPDKPGTQSYTVRIPEQPGERDASNNQAGAIVEVEERKIRVLMIDSEPRWQFRFLRNAMERDAAVTLTVHLARPGVGPITGETYLAELPADRKKLAEFDVIVLGDIERARLGDEFIKEVAEMVRLRSAALMVMAGRQGHYRTLAGTPIGDILPVTLQDSPETAARGGAPFAVELTEIGRGHLLTRLAPTVDENEATWGQLPQLRWAASVAGLAPGADSLLVHPNRLAGADKLPLLAVHQVGTGKVMFCGLDETWRWRREVGDRYFYRFWAQALRWMVKQPFAAADGDAEARRVRLSLDQAESSVGEKVRIDAYCLGADGYPMVNGQVWLRVEPEEKDEARSAKDEGKVAAQQIAMQPAPGGWGVYRAQFAAAKPGVYVIKPILADVGPQPLNTSVRLTVTRANLEKNQLAQDRAALAGIAQASGGEFLAIDQADKLVDLLAGRYEQRTQTVEFSPTRHWAYYGALVLVLSALWLTRKRTGLA